MSLYDTLKNGFRTTTIKTTPPESRNTPISTEIPEIILARRNFIQDVLEGKLDHLNRKKLPKTEHRSLLIETIKKGMLDKIIKP